MTIFKVNHDARNKRKNLIIFFLYCSKYQNLVKIGFQIEDILDMTHFLCHVIGLKCSILGPLKKNYGLSGKTSTCPKWKINYGPSGNTTTVLIPSGKKYTSKVEVRLRFWS